MFPLSSNDTSAVGGSLDSTLLTVLFPRLSPICSPSITLLSLRFGLMKPGQYTPEPLCPALHSRGLVRFIIGHGWTRMDTDKTNGKIYRLKSCFAILRFYVA